MAGPPHRTRSENTLYLESGRSQVPQKSWRIHRGQKSRQICGNHNGTFSDHSAGTPLGPPPGEGRGADGPGGGRKERKQEEVHEGPEGTHQRHLEAAGSSLHRSGLREAPSTALRSELQENVWANIWPLAPLTWTQDRGDLSFQQLVNTPAASLPWQRPRGSASLLRALKQTEAPQSVSSVS